MNTERVAELTKLINEKRRETELLQGQVHALNEERALLLATADGYTVDQTILSDPHGRRWLVWAVRPWVEDSYKLEVRIIRVNGTLGSQSRTFTHNSLRSSHSEVSISQNIKWNPDAEEIEEVVA